MNPKALKTKAEYEMAVAHLETLMSASAGSPEEEELELFAVLIESYEKEHFPIGFPDPVEAVTFRMEQQGLTRKDLVPYIGSQSKVSEVLNHKRPLSLAMIRALNKGLGIPYEVLLQEPQKGLVSQKKVRRAYPVPKKLLPSAQKTSAARGIKSP
jgi:HTH-type transcriptional regulator/antitoxin HigA